jgi:hypothetical protein
MFRRLSCSLLLILALLQCLAPLLHAHYSGVSPSAGPHLHDLPDLEHEHGLMSGERIQASELPAVDFANGLAEAASFSIAPPGLNFLWPAMVAAGFLFCVLATARTQGPFRTPPAQAP